MNSKLSNKAKIRLLYAIIGISGLLIYSLTFKKTIALISSVSALESKIELAKDAPEKSAALKLELALIDRKIGTNHMKDQNQQALLELVTEYCKQNNTVLREFPEVQNATKGDFRIETNRFVVQGSFTSLLSLVYILEQKRNLGKVTSVEYLLKKDPKTKETALNATIYLQNIKKNENN